MTDKTDVSKEREAAEKWLRYRYGAYRGHFAWRELEEAFLAGRASLSANAGEPTFDMRAVVAVAVTMLYGTHQEDVCRVFERHELETIVSLTEPLGTQQVEDIYRAAWDHLAAPPTAQAERLPSRHELALQMLVAGGFVTETKLQQALALVDAACPALAPPTSAEGVEHG